MYNHGWFAGRVATRFPIDEVPFADVQQPLVVGFYFGIELRHVLGRLAQRCREPEADIDEPQRCGHMESNILKPGTEAFRRAALGVVIRRKKSFE